MALVGPPQCERCAQFSAELVDVYEDGVPQASRVFCVRFNAEVVDVYEDGAPQLGGWRWVLCVGCWPLGAW